MAKEKISELTAAATLDGTELVPVVQDGETVQTTAQDIADLAAAPYLKYVALLTQADTDAPVATVLENTLGGTVVWTYSDVGTYTGTLAAAFTTDKTFMLANTNASSSAALAINPATSSANAVQVYVLNDENNPVDLHGGAFIEIRVYP